MKSKLLERIGIALSLALGIAILYYILWRAGIADVGRVIGAASLPLVFAAALIDQISLATTTLRWREFLRAERARRMGLWLLHKINLSGYFAAALTPIARVGGEPVRIFLASKYGETTEQVAASEVAGLVFEVSSMIALQVFAIVVAVTLLNIPPAIFDTLIVVLLIFVTLLVASLEVVLSRRIFLRLVHDLLFLLEKTRLVRHHAKRARRRLLSEMERFESAMRLSIKGRPWRVMALTALRRGLEFTRIGLVLFALGVQLPLPWLLVVVAAMTIAGYLPSPPAGLGVIESAGVAALLLAGVAAPSAAAAIFVDRIITLVPTMIIGFVSLWSAGKGLL